MPNKTNEWIQVANNLPVENENVAIITKDGSGYNAVFKNNSFVATEKTIQVDDTMYWKSTKEKFSEVIDKPCRACGRRR